MLIDLKGSIPLNISASWCELEFKRRVCGYMLMIFEDSNSSNFVKLIRSYYMQYPNILVVWAEGNGNIEYA